MMMKQQLPTYGYYESLLVGVSFSFGSRVLAPHQHGANLMRPTKFKVVAVEERWEMAGNVVQSKKAAHN